MPRSIEDQLEARQLRRMNAEDRALARLERREEAAEKFIGELCREGQTIYYINVRNVRGELTGKTVEFPGWQGWSQAVAYCLRNHYV